MTTFVCGFKIHSSPTRPFRQHYATCVTKYNNSMTKAGLNRYVYPIPPPPPEIPRVVNSRVWREGVGCKKKELKNRRTAATAFGKKKLWREHIIWLHVFIWAEPRVRCAVVGGGSGSDREFAYIYTYAYKTKGYVLLHTYSIWKMAAQGITRRFFSITLPRAKTVGFHFRAFSTLRRARFI